jgi:excisionase family DNA binding protein
MDITDNTSIADFIGQLRNLLTAIELGGYLSVCPKTIFQWSKQGRIPVVRMGSALRFDPKAIATWLRQRTTAI